MFASDKPVTVEKALNPDWGDKKYFVCYFTVMRLFQWGSGYQRCGQSNAADQQRISIIPKADIHV